MTASEKAKAESKADAKADAKDKPMTRGEGVKKLDSIIGTAAPLIEAEHLRRVVAIHGLDNDSELPPELEAAIEDIERRTKDSEKK